MTDIQPAQTSLAGTESADRTAEELINKSKNKSEAEWIDFLARAVNKLPTQHKRRSLEIALDRKLPSADRARLHDAIEALRIHTAQRPQRQSPVTPAASTPRGLAAPPPGSATAQAKFGQTARQLIEDSDSKPPAERIQFLAAAVKRSPRPERKALRDAIDKDLMQNGRDGDRKLLSYALGEPPSHETLAQLRQTAKQLVEDNERKLQPIRIHALADAIRSHPEPERRALEAAIHAYLERKGMSYDWRLLYPALHDGKQPPDNNIMANPPTLRDSVEWAKRQDRRAGEIEEEFFRHEYLLPARAPARPAAARTPAASAVPTAPDQKVEAAYGTIARRLRELVASAPVRPNSGYSRADDEMFSGPKRRYQALVENSLKEMYDATKSLTADQANALVGKLSNAELEWAAFFDSRWQGVQRAREYLQWDSTGLRVMVRPEPILQDHVPALFREALASTVDSADQMARLINAYQDASQRDRLQTSPQSQALSIELNRQSPRAVTGLGTPDYHGDILAMGRNFLGRASRDQKLALYEQLAPQVRTNISYPPILTKRPGTDLAEERTKYGDPRGSILAYTIASLPKDAIVELFQKIDGTKALVEAQQRITSTGRLPAPAELDNLGEELKRISDTRKELMEQLQRISISSMQSFRITQQGTETGHGAEPAPLIAMIEATTTADPLELLGKEGSFGDRGRVVLGNMFKLIVGSLNDYVARKYDSTIAVAEYHLSAAEEPAVQDITRATIRMMESNPLALMAGLHSMSDLAHGQAFQEFGVYLMDRAMMERTFAALPGEVPLIAPPNPKDPHDRGGPLYNFWEGLYGHRTGADRAEYFMSGKAPGEPVNDPYPGDQFWVRRGIAYATGGISGISTLTRNLFEQEMSVLASDQGWVNSLLTAIPGGPKLISPLARAVIGQDTFVTSKGVVERSQYLAAQLNGTHFYLLDLVVPTDEEIMQTNYYWTLHRGTRASVTELLDMETMMNNTFWSGVAEGQRFSNVYAGVNRNYRPGQLTYDESNEGLVYRIREGWENWVREHGRRRN